MFLPELYGSEKSMYDSVINSCHRPIVTSQHGTEDMHATMYDNMTPKEDRWEFKVKRSRRWLNVAIYWYTFSVKKKTNETEKVCFGVGSGTRRHRKFSLFRNSLLATDQSGKCSQLCGCCSWIRINSRKWCSSMQDAKELYTWESIQIILSCISQSTKEFTSFVKKKKDPCYLFL